MAELLVLAQPVELLALKPMDAHPYVPQGQAQNQAPGHFSRQPPSASISPGHSRTFCPTSFQGTPLQCSTVLAAKLVQDQTSLSLQFLWQALVPNGKLHRADPGAGSALMDKDVHALA
ncbi:hypothetical protein llap_10680 [Limosa lapponica baueri]|uniref:Uncharacterized protein n=1 Tax=Limosa lapponica baueri TaxID=1758121 RepID=A0A2I0TYW4_LIMLA|nr:hypothetical protein llap_10680 [Limosa lapponica baueri]